ncbi:hypothetical protein KUCAC02_025070, partial [Chaenocephalus aceratus]
QRYAFSPMKVLFLHHVNVARGEDSFGNGSINDETAHTLDGGPQGGHEKPTLMNSTHLEK